MDQDKIIDHFPLQSNLKKLKYNLQKFISALALPIAFLIQPAEKIYDKLIHNQELLILVGAIAVFIIIILVEYLTRGYYFNHFGIGVIRSFGNKSQWYSFDEMTDLKLTQKGVVGSKNSSTSIKMFFYSGKVSVDSVYFARSGVEELAEIVKKKKHENYGSKEEKPDLVSKAISNLTNDPQPGSLYNPGRSKRSKKKSPFYG